MNSATALPSSLKNGFSEEVGIGDADSFELNSALDADFRSFELGNSFAEFSTKILF